MNEEQASLPQFELLTISETNRNTPTNSTFKDFLNTAGIPLNKKTINQAVS
ncbi:hypothetical protein PEDI_42400 [Persicobacter diffluens]|uniref:Uncharacterized protein n=1 Tax=Persicobacter diffluens TaxID=981 RepID=A0AAN5APC5_9BACT|nr:hypothetical protein PEDI_42400 [Persicobacter diffluens]